MVHLLNTEIIRECVCMMCVWCGVYGVGMCVEGGVVHALVCVHACVCMV